MLKIVKKASTSSTLDVHPNTATRKSLTKQKFSSFMSLQKILLLSPILAFPAIFFWPAHAGRRKTMHSAHCTCQYFPFRYE